MSKGKKKSLFNQAIDALTNRDEREAAEAAQAKALADAARKEAEARARIAAAENATMNQQADDNVATTRATTKHVKTIEETTTKKIAVPQKGVVTVRSLRIRADHNTASEVVGGLVKGNEVMILSTWTDGRDTWAQLDRGWAAMVYRGEIYIEPV